jgi:hypothetical protein
MDSEAEYIKAFNNGFVLAEHNPELLEKVTQNIPPSYNYLEGFFDGKEEYERSKEKAIISEIEQLRNNSKSMDRDFDIERDF